jgi:hypothetical protein
VSADGQRSLREIAHEAGTSDFAVATAVLAMSNAGLLSLSGAQPAEEAEEADDAEEDDDPGERSDFDYDDHAATDAGGSTEASTAEDEDLDPAVLLRELGEQQAPAPRARRLTAASRQEQSLRLRSR